MDLLMNYDDDVKSIIHWLVQEKAVKPKMLKKHWELCQRTGQSFDCRLLDIVYDVLPKEFQDLAGQYAVSDSLEGKTLLVEHPEITSFLHGVGVLKLRHTYIFMPKKVRRRFAKRYNAQTEFVA